VFDILVHEGDEKSWHIMRHYKEFQHLDKQVQKHLSSKLNNVQLNYLALPPQRLFTPQSLEIKGIETTRVGSGDNRAQLVGDDDNNLTEARHLLIRDWLEKLLMVESMMKGKIVAEWLQEGKGVSFRLFFEEEVEEMKRTL